MTDTPAAQLVGTDVDGRFRILRLLGEGAMGTVYEAMHHQSGYRVALKLLRPDFRGDTEVQERFFREGQLVSTLAHPNIVRLAEFGQTAAGDLFLAMEFVDGVLLSEFVRRGRARVPLALAVVSQLASALDAAHRAGAIHRDVKPDNVFLSRASSGHLQLKLVDFGLAHVQAASRLTAAGTIMGTPQYMAPELARGAAASTASDIYAIGAVLYELLTGSVPFPRENPVQALMAHVDQPVPDPGALSPDCPPAVRSLTSRLLAKEPGQRPPSCAAVKAEADQLMAAIWPQPISISQPGAWGELFAWAAGPGEGIASVPPHLGYPAPNQYPATQPAQPPGFQSAPQYAAAGAQTMQAPYAAPLREPSYPGAQSGVPASVTPQPHDMQGQSAWMTPRYPEPAIPGAPTHTPMAGVPAGYPADSPASSGLRELDVSDFGGGEFDLEDTQLDRPAPSTKSLEQLTPAYGAPPPPAAKKKSVGGVIAFALGLFFVLAGVTAAAFIMLDLKLPLGEPEPVDPSTLAPKEFDLQAPATRLYWLDFHRGVVAARTFSSIPARGHSAVILDSLEDPTPPGAYYVVDLLEGDGTGKVTADPLSADELKQRVVIATVAADAAMSISDSADVQISESRIAALEAKAKKRKKKVKIERRNLDNGSQGGVDAARLMDQMQKLNLPLGLPR